MSNNVHDLFKNQELNVEGMKKVRDLRVAFTDILGELDSISPGRELSIAYTKLEEACMFAIKAVSKDPTYRA
jgi:hypothetical protein